MSIGRATTGTWMHIGGFYWRSSRVKQGPPSFLTAAEVLLRSWRNRLPGQDEGRAQQSRMCHGIIAWHDMLTARVLRRWEVGLLHGSSCDTRLFFSVRLWCGLVTKCWANPRFPETAKKPRLALVLLRLCGGNGRVGREGVDYVV